MIQKILFIFICYLITKISFLFLHFQLSQNFDKYFNTFVPDGRGELVRKIVSLAPGVQDTLIGIGEYKYISLNLLLV